MKYLIYILVVFILFSCHTNNAKIKSEVNTLKLENKLLIDSLKIISNKLKELSNHTDYSFSLNGPMTLNNKNDTLNLEGTIFKTSNDFKYSVFRVNKSDLNNPELMDLSNTKHILDTLVLKEESQYFSINYKPYNYENQDFCLFIPVYLNDSIVERLLYWGKIKYN